MRRTLGILMVVLIMGLMVSPAVSTGSLVAAAEASNSNAVYKDFWAILENESYLVYKLNATNDLSIAPALVKNSRLGEENAANISALIWLAREELKASGIKTYYTADELREMARDISKNGLPDETVRALKEQGWTDEEIKALENYIAKNADNITGDFDMLGFLQNFSRAFLDVAFKYASYESWALKKWKWDASPSFKGSLPDNVSIAPFLADEWVKLYAAYANNTTEQLISSSDELSDDMYGIFTSRASVKSHFLFLWQGKVISGVANITGVEFYNDGFVLVTANAREKTGSTVDLVEYRYYWPTALKAYNLTRQIHAIAVAIERGNGDSELRWILNEKMDELREALMVHVSKRVVEYRPPHIRKPPIHIEPPTQPIELLSNSGGVIQMTSSEKSGSSIDGLIVSTPTPMQIEALTPENNEGIIEINKVAVVVDEKSGDSVKYHIEVSVTARNNAVSGVKIHLNDYTSGSSDGKSVSLMSPGESLTWDSKEFSVSPSGDTVTITGEVSVTYTPSCGDTPTSRPGNPSVATCYEPHTITKSYSKTVQLQDPIDPSKVHFSIIPSKSQVTAGTSVDFYIEVRNDNKDAVTGSYSVEVSVPMPHGNYQWSSPFTDTVTVPAGDTERVYIGTITYGAPGTSNYYGSFDFGVSSASDSGEVIIIRSGGGDSTGVRIVDVHTDPSSGIKEGDSVSFNVLVNNSYSSGKQVELELFIDGKEVDSVSGSINAGSEKSFTLHWTAEAGEHSYVLKLYNLIGGQEFQEDSVGGGIKVTNSGNQSTVSIESFTCTPREVGLYEWGGDRDVVLCTAVVVNNGSPVQIAPRMAIDGIETFWLDVKNLPVDSKITLGYKVKFDDKLAQMMYGPSATALVFVRSVEKQGGTVCKRGVCYNTTVIYFLPENHTISLRIYRAINFMPTNEVLTKTEGKIVTVKYDGYVEKKMGLYYLKVGKTAVEVLGIYATLEYAIAKGGAEAGLKEVGKEVLRRILDWIAR